MDEPELTDKEFSEKHSLSPSDIRKHKANMVFDSPLSPGHKINKTAYIYELLISPNPPSIDQIRALASRIFHGVQLFLVMKVVFA